MPSCCCVPECFSNSCKGPLEKVKVFTFPKDEERKALWIKEIGRKNWSPGQNSAVCIYHFKDDDIIKDCIAHKFDEASTYKPRYRFRLKPSAVPSILPGSPLFRMPRHVTVRVEENKINDCLEDDRIVSFNSLFDVNKLNTLEINPGWKCQIETLSLTYYKMSVGKVPIHVASSITIYYNMTVDVFIGKNKVKHDDLLFLSEIDKKLSIQLWSQLENLMNYLDSAEKDDEEKDK